MKNVLDSLTLSQLLKSIDGSIVLSSHINPDGDGIGSMLALGSALESLGKEIHYILKEPIRDFYNTIPLTNKIKYNLPQKPFTLMTFDCSSKDIISLPKDYQKQVEKLIVLDHHLSNKYFGDYNYIKTNYVSSCILAYDAIVALGATITPEIATNLYLGIVFDTERFSYTSDPEVFNLAAKLLELKADHQLVFNCLYRHNSLKQFKTNAKLIQKIESLHEGKLLLLEIDKDFLNQIDNEESEGLINQISNIKDLEIISTLKYIDEQTTKASFRSRGNFSVSDLALSFGGGGHRFASGATIALNIKDAKKAIISKVSNFF